MIGRVITIGVLLGAWALCSAADVDRAVAEWVLHVGGSVVLEGTTRQIWDAADLPASDFQLHTVNLSTSLIPPADLKRLGALPRLKDLYLSGRTWHNVPVKVTADSLKLLEGLTSLERFILTLPVQVEIPIEDPAIANIASLTHLQQLRLAQTRIKGRTLAAFTEMRSLDLTNTRLDDQGMRSLQGMTHLQKLYAHDALITDEGLQYIRNLHELTELDLYNTRITDAGLVYLKGLTNLRKLNLLGASVTDAGLDQLTGLTKLTELNLYRTQITNSGLEKLKAFQDLRELDVRYTRITRGGLAAFAAANPRCQVAFLDASVGPSETRAAGPSVAGKGTAAITRWVQSRGGTAVVEAGRIREISLASTATTDADLASLRGLDLRKLDLSFTEVSDVGLQTLGVAEHCPLAEIYLANTTVSDAGLKSLRSCQSLRKLGLAYTLVRGDGLDALPAAITDLDLTGLSFSAEGLSRIARFTGLQHLDLKYSDIDDAGLVHL
ncbi:MAG TPA: hypothetical protein VG672_04830, partial [Bryobacteraceae bacterium]|nr:hypothetical protein [Bryobacteraceae bacterium]